MAPTSRCVVLVPVGGVIDSGCEDGLRELERRGYPVWRIRGYAAIDAARNQMASDALAHLTVEGCSGIGKPLTPFIWPT